MSFSNQVIGVKDKSQAMCSKLCLDSQMRKIAERKIAENQFVSVNRGPSWNAGHDMRARGGEE